MDDFKEIMDAIDLFIEADDVDRWKRCLVCGVCRIPNGIALNIAQLKKLVFKCKSSINGSLKGLGYDIVIGKTSTCSELFEALPQLRLSPGELRQWTVRMRSVPLNEAPSDMTAPMDGPADVGGFGLSISGDESRWQPKQGGIDPFDFDHGWFEF
jgi:hypothetical protein